MKLFDKTKIPLLENALDVYALRARVSATNIANVTTPGYRARRVEFENELSKALQRGNGGVHVHTTHERHIPIQTDLSRIPRPHVVETPDTQSLSDDELASGMNNVDIDYEMAELAKNQIRFRFAARMISGQFQGLQKSIRGHL